MPKHIGVKTILFSAALAISAPPPLWAQKLSELVASNPYKEYGIIKTALKGIRSLSLPARPKEYDITKCHTLSDDYSYGGGNQDFLGSLVLLATQIEVRSNDLRRLGFPAHLWEPVFREHERVQIETALKLRSNPPELEEAMKDQQWKMYGVVAAKLNSYQRNHRSLPRIVMLDGCGGPGTEIYIETEPKGASVFLIQSFYYKLCIAKKYDPEDRENCDKWEEPYLTGSRFQYNGHGEFRYLAIWGSGTRRGALNLDKLRDGTTITIRLPK